jgi:hypothetical protein
MMPFLPPPKTYYPSGKPVFEKYFIGFAAKQHTIRIELPRGNKLESFSTIPEPWTAAGYHANFGGSNSGAGGAGAPGPTGNGGAPGGSTFGGGGSSYNGGTGVSFMLGYCVAMWRQPREAAYQDGLDKYGVSPGPVIG